jgi:Fe-Mn family superoxide dismutase
MRLSADWGTFDAWMADFMACAMTARSGWVVCGYSLYLKRMINTFVDNHDQNVLLGVIPLLVVDMWEHAYVRDYGNDKKSYLTAMMREISWDVVEDRVKRVDALKKVLG